MDFPNHHTRRIKSVTVSIPCVVGPYTSLNATLTLKDSTYRTKDGSLVHVYPQDIPTSSIVVSSAQRDAGAFELDFRDERYMPFENAGVARYVALLRTPCISFPPPPVLIHGLCNYSLHLHFSAALS